MTAAERNTERVRQIYAHYAAGNLEAVIGALSPDVVWESEGADLPWSGRGACCDDVRSYFTRLSEACEVRAYEVEKMVAQDDTVVVLCQVVLNFRASGREERFRKVDTIRLAEDGKVLEFREYYDTGRAKAALEGR